MNEQQAMAYGACFDDDSRGLPEGEGAAGGSLSRGARLRRFAGKPKAYQHQRTRDHPFQGEANFMAPRCIVKIQRQNEQEPLFETVRHGVFKRGSRLRCGVAPTDDIPPFSIISVQSYSPAGLHSGHLPFSSQRNKTSTIAFAGTGQGSPGVWRVR